MKTHIFDSYNDKIFISASSGTLFLCFSQTRQEYCKNTIPQVTQLSINTSNLATIIMSNIEINNEAAGQFSNLKRRTFGIECEFIGLTSKNISQDAIYGAGIE